MAPKTTLISTAYRIEPILPAVKRLMPERIILLVGLKSEKTSKEPENDEKQREAKEKLKEIEKALEFLKIEKVERATDQFDIFLTAEQSVKAIDEEAAAGRRIVADITGGRKTMSIGLLFACYARRDKVDKAIYTLDGTDEFIELPMLSFSISKDRKELLGKIENGKLSITEIARSMKRSRAFIYQQLVKMKREKYVAYNDGKFTVTMAGKIARL